MSNHNYQIRYLPSFSEDLEEILSYITYKLKNKKVAINFLKHVHDSIIHRSNNPKDFEIYKSTKDRKYNWYRIYVGNYIIFYIVRNHTMEIARLLYNKRNLKKIHITLYFLYFFSIF